MPELDIVGILNIARARNASDVYLIAGRPPLLRCGEALEAALEGELTPEAVRRMVDELLNEEQRQRFERREEVDLSFAVPGVGRFRMNAYWQRGTAAAVLRVIPERVPRLEELGLPPQLGELALAPRGLLLVTGPTGSGKSTTLAALVDHISQQRACHIVTIEDPVEYHFEHGRGVVSQREVGVDTPGFHEALRAALRQPPRVIMVGELRDRRTISTALTAAETGHLVLGTLHTRSADETVERIVHAFDPAERAEARARLAAGLTAVLAQQLLPGTGGGLVLAYELLIATPAVRALIREGKVHQLPSVIATSRDLGMITLDACLAELVAQRRVAPEVARAYARDPQALEGGVRSRA